MSVLSQFFNKKSPKRKSLAEKIAELDTMTIEQRLAIVSAEEDEQLRLAVIDRLDFGTDLCSFAFDSNASSNLQLQAKKRIADLIDNDIVSFAQLVNQCSDVLLQLSILGLCKQSGLVEQILSESNDREFFYILALEGKSAKVRQLAAGKIDDISKLKPLLKLSKTKDKAVYKIVRDKLEKLKTAEKKETELQVSIDSISQQIASHSKKIYDKLYTAKLGQLVEHWQQIKNNASADEQRQVEILFAKCEAVVEKYHQEQRDIQLKAEAIGNAQGLQKAAIEDVKEIVVSLYVKTKLESGFQQGALDTLSAIKLRWSDSEKYKSAQTADKKIFEALTKAVHSQLKIFETHGPLSDIVNELIDSQSQAIKDSTDSTDSTSSEETSASNSDVNFELIKILLKNTSFIHPDRWPPSVISAKKIISDRDRLDKEKKSDAKNRLRHLSSLIRKADEAMQKGSSRKAGGLRRSIEEKKASLDSIPEYISRQIEQLDESLDKLLDWKNYAVEPKKQQLIEQMQLLLDSSDNPEALAVKIKRLQDEWKVLSKGGGDHDQLLWDTFHEIAQKAYEPCKVFYQEKSRIRIENLEKRQLLVSQLKDFLNSQNWIFEDELDNDNSEVSRSENHYSHNQWKNVEKIFSTALKQWHEFSPVERRAIKSVQLEFDQTLAVIKNKLAIEYTKNKQLKESLIEKAKVALDIDDHRKATDEIKQLQKLWKNCGITLHKDDRKLWKEFRASCDQVFKIREEKISLFKSELNANKEKALRLCEQLLSLANLTGQPLLDAKGDVERINAEFIALEAFPKSDEKEIRRGFARAMEQFDSALVAHRKSAKEQIWANLLAADDKIRKYQITCLSTDGSATGEQEKDMVTFIESLIDLPKNGHKALTLKLNSNISNQDKGKYLNALKLICIRAEILSDNPTPDGDQSLRMEYQVERLKSGFGQKSVETKAELNSLLMEWVEVGPVEKEQYDLLLERFMLCR